MKRPRPFLAQLRVSDTPRAPRAKQHERDLQNDLIDFHGVAVVNPLEAVLFAVPNGELRDKVTAAILSGRRKRHPLEPPETDVEMMTPHGLGLLPGAVDLILLLARGRVCLIELKRPATEHSKKGTLSTPQKCFRRTALALGHWHVVLDAVEAYERLLIGAGVRLRVRSIWPRYPTHPAPVKLRLAKP